MARSSSEGMFADAWNPTADEIRLWAYADCYAPDQDWDLALEDHAALLVELVDAPSVGQENRLFLLGALYTLVGDRVRTATAVPVVAPDLAPILADAEHRCAPLQRWARESEDLLRGAQPFRREEWGLDSDLALREPNWFER